MSAWRSVGSQLVRAALRSAGGRSSTGRGRAAPAAFQRPSYRGDFTGTARIEYTPSADGDADPGEVVWAWVPFEEDHSRGKDRPVLVIGRSDGDLLALMLTSRDHDRDAADESRHGRTWMDVGAGSWDVRGRPSEVRLDRILRLSPAGVRREGARLDRARFDEVAGALTTLHGWR